MYEFLDDVTIVVPSLGRAGRVHVLSEFEDELRERVVMAVHAHEVAKYRAAADNSPMQRPGEFLTLTGTAGIAKTRQALTDWCPTRFLLQISDDVRFYRRYTGAPDERKGRRASRAEVTQMIGEMYDFASLNEVAHIGPDRYLHNDKHAGRHRFGGRMFDVYMHDVNVLRSLGVRWDRVQVMEDFDVTLQLIGWGLPNVIMNYRMWDRAIPSNAPGGCSTYRTPAVQEAGARRLEELHPGIVRAQEKPARDWQGNGFNGRRWDVTVQWSKAMEQAGITPTGEQQP